MKTELHFEPVYGGYLARMTLQRTGCPLVKVRLNRVLREQIVTLTQWRILRSGLNTEMRKLARADYREGTV